MNYQSGAMLGSFQGVTNPTVMIPHMIPIDADWKRVNLSLAGFGHVVAGTISDPVTATIGHAAQATCTITHSVKGA